MFVLSRVRPRFETFRNTAGSCGCEFVRLRYNESALPDNDSHPVTVDHPLLGFNTLDFGTSEIYRPQPITIESGAGHSPASGSARSRDPTTAARGPRPVTRVEISMDANNLPTNSLSRRRFIELLGLGVPLSVALAPQCQRHDGSEQVRHRSGGSAAAPAAKPRTGSCPGSLSRRSARTRSSGSTPRTRSATISYNEFQNDAYKTKIKTAIGAGQGADDHLGLGRRRAAAATSRPTRSKISPTGSHRTPT